MSKMNLSALVLIISSILFNFCNKSPNESNEFIAFNNDDSVILIDYDGKFKKKIVLPSKIEYDFKIKNDFVCYVGEENQIHLYNWKKRMLKKVPKGPYIFKDNEKYGPERYNDIDFSMEDNMIVFTAYPEYFNFSKGSVPNFLGAMNEPLISNVVILCLSEKNPLKIELEENSENSENKPFIMKKKMIYQDGVSIKMYDFNSMKVDSLSDKLKDYYSFKERGLILGLISCNSREIIFAEFQDNLLRSKNLYTYNVEKGSFQKFHTIRDFRKLIISILGDVDISSDKKKLVFIEENKRIFLFDLENYEKKIIYKSKKEIIKAHFFSYVF